jgi:hypothetical protein
MRRREILVIAAAAATPLVIAWAVLVIINTPAEGIISKERALKIVSDYPGYDVIAPNTPEPKFAVIKYNDTTAEGNPRFLWLDADASYNSPAVFSVSEGNYFSNQTEDRFVWVVFRGDLCYATYFVDASTGELVGIDGSRGFCTYCWHMYGAEYSQLGQ